MAMKRARSYSRVTKQALSLFGKLIKAGRLERRMTATELAERAGITRRTLRNIENGEAGSEIGTVFEVATLVGVRLFDVDERTLAIHNAHLEDKITLLPKSVRPSKQEVDDDF
jgi:transcriptional regulator with XRE-family HTH domain